MKKVLFALMCLFPLVLFADGVELPNAPKCWTVPAVFTADEEVTFYYDMTDVGFQEVVTYTFWLGSLQRLMQDMEATHLTLLNWSILVIISIKRRWYQRSIFIVTSLSLKMLTGQASGKG